MSEPLLTMYAVRNKDGKYFRSKGYCGSGETWVDDIKNARIYPKPGPARSQVTFFAGAYPRYGVPDIVELRVTEVVAVDETIRVQKSLDRKAVQQAKWKLRSEAIRFEMAQKKLKEAQEELARLAHITAEVEARRQSRMK